MCSSNGGILRALLLPALVHCCATLRTVGVVPKSYFVDAAYLPPPKMLDSSSLQVRQLVAARSPRVLSIWPLQGDSLVVDPVPDDAVLSAPSSDVVLDAEHSISVSFTLDAISGAQSSRARLGNGSAREPPARRWLGPAASTGAASGTDKRISRRGEHAAHHMALPPQYRGASNSLRQVQLQPFAKPPVVRWH